MEPFFGNRSLYGYQHPDRRYAYSHSDPRYAYSHSPSYPAFPAHRVDPWETSLPLHPGPRPTERAPPAQKVVRIPVQSVGSKKPDPSGCALKIQKIYRGFLVRKCLKKIKDIKAKVDEIGEKLSTDHVVELIRKDEKERLRMNETLMSLLIQLDSISGLDFGVRQCRKAVIRKAISLQEKIDAIVATNLNGSDESPGNDDQGSEIQVATDVGTSNQPVGSIEVPENCADTAEISGGTTVKTEEPEVVDVGVDREVKVGGAHCDAESGVVSMEKPGSSSKAEENVRDEGGDNKRNRELLEKMMEENEKMMRLMTPTF